MPEFDLVHLVSKILAAHVISENFKMEQTMGNFLGNYMQLMYNDSLETGFSGYSSEACHESIHGNGTCSFSLARDFKCKSELKKLHFVPLSKLLNFFPTDTKVWQVDAEALSETMSSLNMNEVAYRFDFYMTRIETGRVNEPITIMETNQFPTHFFCSATRGWPGHLDPDTVSPEVVLQDCNTAGYDSGFVCDGQRNHGYDCVLLEQSNYRYLEVTQTFEV